MYDLAVIGLGPAGIEACNIAIKNRLNVVAFENNKIGGTCLNVGCIPTKAILHCANVYSDIKNSDKLGINVAGTVSFDWKKIIERSESIVSKFNKALESNFKNKLTIVNSEAEIELDEAKITIISEFNVYEAKNVIIATGSIPIELSNLKFNHTNILSSDDIFNLEKLPKSITIIGSGAVGAEWAYIFASFGMDVKIVEKMPELAFNLDIDASKRLERILKSKNIKIFKNTTVMSFDGSEVLLESGDKYAEEAVLVAVGRKPRPLKTFVSGFLGDYILKPVNCFETEFENVFLAGDATGCNMLAHSASFASRCILNKLLYKKNFSEKLIPSVIYTSPEIACVGLREQDIDDGCIIKKLPVASVAKSWCDEASDGIIKLIIKDNTIKGAHIVSKEASSFVSLLQYFIENETNISEIKNFVFPHPSYVEIISEVLNRG